MKILYRPQRATLDEAMAELKEFKSLKECFEHIVAELDGAVKLDDIYVQYYDYDERIDWETYLVCVCKVGDENFCQEYGTPQGWGFLTFKE